MARLPLSILAVGLNAAQRDRLEKAGGREVQVIPLGSLDEALDRPAPEGATTAVEELLVLAPDLAPEQDRALAAVGADALPRWPVVIFGADALDAPIAEAIRLHGVRRDAARARGDLLTIARRISHELRSPLGCILTSADVLREELADSPAPGMTLMEPIVESANEVLALVDRVSLIARASAEPVPAPADIDVGMAVWSAREYLAGKITATGAEVTEPEDWPLVPGVRPWFDRIWHCLLANALQHAGPKPRIELGWEHVDGDVRFFVRDHGPGVPEEIRDSLFRPFHRLHERDSGRGLGLAIVRRLVELQGGTCGYHPAKAGGSCFHFSVPAARE